MTDSSKKPAAIRYGFIGLGHLGGLLARSLIRGGFAVTVHDLDREAARLIAPLHARPGCDYVFIARGGTATRPWARLLDDMRTTLQRLAADL